MQKELSKPSGITPEIQAYIDSLVESATQKISKKYEARIADMWEQFRHAQAKRYLPQSEKFPA